MNDIIEPEIFLMNWMERLGEILGGHNSTELAHSIIASSNYQTINFDPVSAVLETVDLAVQLDVFASPDWGQIQHT